MRCVWTDFQIDLVGSILAVIPVDVSDRARDTTAGQCIFQPADSAAIIRAAQIELQKTGPNFKKARLWETLSRLIHNESKCLALLGM